MARPSKLTELIKRQAEKLARLGLTDAEMADVWEVTEATITNWKSKSPEFFVPLKAGKAIADSKVERRLFERACGYSHPEDKIFCHQGKTTVIHTTKHYPPDTTACIFWLKNRQRENWRERQGFIKYFQA